MGIRRLFVGALVLAAACGDQTGIRVDVTLSSALEGRLTDQVDFDTLRIYVGTATTDTRQFISSDGAFLTRAVAEDEVKAGFRYLLEPDGGLGEIGPIMVAASVGRAGSSGRMDIVGFAASPVPTTFADGEVRIIELALAPDTGAASGAQPACVRWQDGQIAPVDDRDCDGAIGQADCDDADPGRNQLDLDQDGQTSCAGDCMELRRSDLPWVDPATVFVGSEEEGRASGCVQVDFDCDGVCGDRVDSDGSLATACGTASADGLVCAPEPADCDESRPGNNPSFTGAGEACNAKDDNCDGFLPPPLPCLYRDDNGKCHVGTTACDEVEGEYAGERDGQLKCSPGAFSGPNVADGVCTSVSTDQICLEDGDPIGCASEGLTAPRVQCTVNARPGIGQQCAPDRRVLNPPVLATQCLWFVVGGVRQADWEVGFVEDANAPPDAPVMPSSTHCTPVLSARGSTPQPSQRTVLLLFGGGLGGMLQPVLLELQPGGELCTGVMTCTGTGPIVEM